MAGTVKKLQFSEGINVGAPDDLSLGSAGALVTYPDDATFVISQGAATDGDAYLNSTIKKFRYYLGAWQNAVPESDSADPTKRFLLDLTGSSTGITNTLDFNSTSNRIFTFPNFDGTMATLAGAEAFTNKTGLTFAASAAINWAAGNASIGASIGANTLTIGGSTSTIRSAGALSSLTLLTDSDDFVLNNDAVSSGADWKSTLRRPSSGMSAAAIITLPTATATLSTLALAETLSTKTLIGTVSITLAASGAIDWAAGSVAIGASIGANTMTLAGSSSTVRAPGALSSGTLLTDSDDHVLNNDAAASGADWKLTLRRPSSGMSAAAIITLPTATATVATLGLAEILSSKTLADPIVTGVLTIAAGLVGTPSLAGTGASSNSGLWFSATDVIALSSNGAKSWEVSTTGDHTLGVLVSGNSNGNRHLSSGYLYGANVTSLANSGAFGFGTNIRYPGANAAEQGRTDATTGGAGIRVQNMTSDTSFAAMGFYLNKATDTTGTAAVAAGGVAQNKTWQIGDITIIGAGGTGVYPGQKIVGATDASSQSAGYIGEVLSQNAVGSVTPAATGTFKTVTSISLTAGRWFVRGGVHLSTSVTTSQRLQAGISLTDNALDVTNKANHSIMLSSTLDLVCPTGTGRTIIISSTTTVYLVALLQYTVLGSAVFSTDCYIEATRLS